LLREHRKCYLRIFVIFTLPKLLGRLFHYSKGIEFVRECKLYKDLVLNPDHRISFERCWCKLKKILIFTIKGNFLRIWTGIIWLRRSLIWLLFWVFLCSILDTKIVYTKTILFSAWFVYLLVRNLVYENETVDINIKALSWRHPHTWVTTSVIWLYQFASNFTNLFSLKNGDKYKTQHPSSGAINNVFAQQICISTIGVVNVVLLYAGFQ
jgi:hypothetical protein